MAGKGLKLAAGIGAASAAMAAFAAIKFIKDSSRAAADFEMMSGSFETLLGSASAAAERIKELMAFSVKTPFEPTELIKASKMLQGMGGETLAIGEGLTMIGDAATQATRPLEEVARNVGKMFLRMKAGESFKEPLTQLQEMGTMSEKGYASLNKLNTEMAKGTRIAMTAGEALDAMQEGMAQSAGEMDKASRRHGGMVSTMKGNIELLRISFGDGINKGLNEGVKLMNEKIPAWQDGAKKLGDAIGLGIGQAFQGNFKLLELQVSFVFSKLAEIGSAIFLKTTSMLIANGMTQIIPKLLGRDRANLLRMGVSEEELAGLMGEGPIADLMTQSARDYDWKTAMKSTQGYAGSEGFKAEMLAELVRVREAIEKAPVVEKKAAEEAAITSTVFGGVTYHHAGGGAPLAGPW